ncbi:MAG: prepilin-type N-terminal cleavage/methylation domain-containing protein [Desulfobacteraceae bacterium]|nr:prepilin-type N-terminal cleavage/methylation domain-containing protein [Desulfobacteraceae bacterium]
MRSRISHHVTSRSDGFSLVEIIVTLIAASIFATILIQFLGTNTMRSYEPVIFLSDNMLLQQNMENITAEYKRILLTTPAQPLNALKSWITPPHVNGGVGVDENRFVQFVDSAETDCVGACHVLKVTISKGDHSLTALFTD